MTFKEMQEKQDLWRAIAHLADDVQDNIGVAINLAMFPYDGTEEDGIKYFLEEAEKEIQKIKELIE
jgi:hypothetical protein